MKKVKKEVEIRCRSCRQYRFKVESLQPEVKCPNCSMEWRLHWFSPDQASIMGPVSWEEFYRREREGRL